MKPFILAIALMATGANAADFLGHTPTGQWLFDYQGVKAVCARSGGTEVLCITESDQWLLCEYKDPEQGYFDNCLPTEDPNLTPA